MYDFLTGCALLFERASNSVNDQIIDDYAKGIRWFRQNNPEAYMALRVLTMNLLTLNNKLKKTSKELGLRVFNFGIPAYKSSSGKLTCPMVYSCVKFCYTKTGEPIPGLM